MITYFTEPSFWTIDVLRGVYSITILMLLNESVYRDYRSPVGFAQKTSYIKKKCRQSITQCHICLLLITCFTHEAKNSKRVPKNATLK